MSSFDCGLQVCDGSAALWRCVTVVCYILQLKLHEKFLSKVKSHSKNDLELRNNKKLTARSHQAHPPLQQKSPPNYTSVSSILPDSPMCYLLH